MDIAIQDEKVDETTIELTGRFDAHEAQGFRDIVDTLVGRGSSDLQIVMTKVAFVDSTALAELVRAMKHCREHGGDMVLVEPSDPVRVILELTRLDLAFTIT